MSTTSRGPSQSRMVGRHPGEPAYGDPTGVRTRFGLGGPPGPGSATKHDPRRQPATRVTRPGHAGRQLRPGARHCGQHPNAGGSCGSPDTPAAPQPTAIGSGDSRSAHRGGSPRRPGAAARGASHARHDARGEALEPAVEGRAGRSSAAKDQQPHGREQEGVLDQGLAPAAHAASLPAVRSAVMKICQSQAAGAAVTDHS